MASGDTSTLEQEIRELKGKVKKLRKQFRFLHGVEPSRDHHPVGAYLPVGQLDGDCSCGRGSWPCETLYDINRTNETGEDQ